MAMAGIEKRQFNNGGNNNEFDGNGQDWWWTPAGMATRYGIVAALFALVILFFAGGYYHAQRRLRKGQPPLAYHRWMVRTHPQFYNPQPRYAYPHDPYAPGYGPSYGMEGYPPPPPAYTNAEAPPPVYQPPPGATKAMADQNFAHTNRAGESSNSAGVTEPATAARQ